MRRFTLSFFRRLLLQVLPLLLQALLRQRGIADVACAKPTPPPRVQATFAAPPPCSPPHPADKAPRNSPDARSRAPTRVVYLEYTWLLKQSTRVARSVWRPFRRRRGRAASRHGEPRQAGRAGDGLRSRTSPSSSRRSSTWGHMYVSGLRGMLKPAEKALGDFVDVKALKKASSTTPRSTTRLVDRTAARRCWRPRVALLEVPLAR